MIESSPPGDALFGSALSGIRVLEFSQLIAGPVAGVALSDFGADVIKVEPLEGETRRNAAAVVPNEGKYFQSLNRGKRSLTIDLSKPEGRAIVHRMIPAFDVVVINYREGVSERLEVDYATLSRLNPALVYAKITGWGEAGPLASRGGSDVVAQAYTGLLAAEGKVDAFGAPHHIIGTPLVDRASALAVAMGICAALFHRERTGEGQEIHASLLQTGLELLAHLVMREPVHDVTLRDPLVAQLQEKRAAGGRYDELVALRKGWGAMIASQRLYYGGYHTARGALILGALTRPNRDAVRAILDMTDDTDSPDFDARDPGNQALVEEWRLAIQQKLLDQPAEEWVEAFLVAGVPATVVNLPEEMADDPQVRANGMMSELEHAITGPQLVVGPLIRMSKSPTAAVRAAPTLGGHSRAILRELGWSDSEIEPLLAAGVISSGFGDEP